MRTPPENDDRVLISIIVSQTLAPELTTLEYVLVVVDDITRRWRAFTSGRGRKLLEASDKLTVLQAFTDNYTLRIEGDGDLPDDERARVWYEHVCQLSNSV